MANQYTILVIEEDTSVTKLITTLLVSRQYHVLTARTGSEGLALLSSYCPDMLLLALNLPDIDGLQMIRIIREWSSIPILVVSARCQERDKVFALDLGADDYITKPFHSNELLARIRTAFRHVRDGVLLPAAKGVFQAGDLVLNYEKRKVLLAGQEIRLTQTEYNILCLLSLYSGKVLTHNFLLQKVWGPRAGGDNRILRVNITNIRRKIEPPYGKYRYIFTEVGVGYRLLEGCSLQKEQKEQFRGVQIGPLF